MCVHVFKCTHATVYLWKSGQFLGVAFFLPPGIELKSSGLVASAFIG